MHRLLRATIASALLLVLLVPVVQAAKPGNTCGADASGYFLVNRDIWWDITVAGIEAEGVQVYEADGTTFTAAFEQFATDLGFADGAALESFVRDEQWAGIDHNGNGLVCMKRRPITPGNPAYFFNGVDDEASSPLGDVDPGED